MNVVIAAVLALLCAPASARAQPTGELSGSIYDQTGAPLPGVRVTIRGVTDRDSANQRRRRLRVSQTFRKATTRSPQN